MTVLKHSASHSGRARPVPRWVAPVFAVLGAATIPWTVHLAMSLPPQAPTHNYRVSWVGFDILLIVALLATAYFSWRGWRHVGVVAATTATLLAVDAWFDVTTSRPADMSAAILSAALVELPLAVVCGWIAVHVDRVVERRLHQLARRARFRAGLRTGPEAGATAEACAADELR